MESKFYIYGDVHNYVKEAQRFLDYEKPKKVIWLGDFTDSYSDTPKIMEATGEWLAHTINTRKNDVFILSNHDLSYRFPTQAKWHNWGFTPDKCRAFHSKFPRELWERFVISYEQKWLDYHIVASHAGWKPKFFPRDVYTKEQAELLSRISLANANDPKWNPVLDDGHGPLWTRWPALGLLDDVCQIVGHTPHEKPQLAYPPKSQKWNLCLDCAHTYYAVFKERHAYAVNRKTGMEHLLRLPHEPEKTT